MNNHRKFPEIAIHIFVWFLVFAFPFLLIDHSNNTADVWKMYLKFSEMPCYMMAIFYMNYLWLAPKLLFSDRTISYVVWNVLLVVCIAFMLHFSPWVQFPPEVRGPEMESDTMHHAGRAIKERVMGAMQQNAPPHHGMRPPRWIFFVRDMITLLLSAAVSALLRIASRWRASEAARLEVEREKTEAELDNLKNQLNPHFLLNTLNNIYALIAFNTEKAQEAVLDLSKLLRYVLYDNQTTYVPLYKEATFIHNYIDLMRIRLSENVVVQQGLHIEKHSTTLIAPMIFISLIENAFKHGVSPSEPSYIHILLEEDDLGIVTCLICNSNFPKKDSDKSGSGIGLEQVQKRLDLLYPGRYEWERGVSVDGKNYSSQLRIHTKLES